MCCSLLERRIPRLMSSPLLSRVSMPSELIPAYSWHLADSLGLNLRHGERNCLSEPSVESSPAPTEDGCMMSPLPHLVMLSPMSVSKYHDPEMVQAKYRSRLVDQRSLPIRPRSTSRRPHLGATPRPSLSLPIFPLGDPTHRCWPRLPARCLHR